MRYIRWLTSILLIICVGFETGIFTTIFAILVTVSLEIIISILKTQREILEILSKRQHLSKKS